MSLFIKNIFLVQLCLILAILYPTSLANLVVEVGTRHSHQTLLENCNRHGYVHTQFWKAGGFVRLVHCRYLKSCKSRRPFWMLSSAKMKECMPGDVYIRQRCTERWPTVMCSPRVFTICSHIDKQIWVRDLGLYIAQDRHTTGCVIPHILNALPWWRIYCIGICNLVSVVFCKGRCHIVVTMSLKTSVLKSH